MAGGSPLTRMSSRYSSDIDIFHDREERVVQAAQLDGAILEAGGYEVRWIRRERMILAAEVSNGEGQTRLEWVADSDFRFFPTLADPDFGFVLHPVDLATNKVMAAAGRQAVRDLVDLLTVHRRILPIGAVVWAAVEKAPGFTPEGLIAEIRRNSNYPREEWRTLICEEPIDPVSILDELRSVLNEAAEFVSRMPTSLIGLIFLDKDGAARQPDPHQVADFQAHAGQRGGHWPTNPEIMRSMLEKYGGKP